jgi:hypothetical protein
LIKKNTNNRLFTRNCNLVTNRAQQLLPWWRLSLDWFLSPFPSFYTTFSHPDPPLKPFGLLYLLDKDATRVVLTQPLPRRMTRFTLWLRDLRAWRKCKPVFSSLGWHCWGWVYNSTNTKIKINTKWLSLAAIVPAWFLRTAFPFRQQMTGCLKIWKTPGIRNVKNTILRWNSKFFCEPRPMPNCKSRTKENRYVRLDVWRVS